MPTLTLRIEDLTAGLLQGLVDASVREDQNLDFKSALPDLDGKNGAKAKRDLLSDVCAFANAGGGDIVMGIDEGRDGEGRANGVAVRVGGVQVDNLDALERRWTQIIEAGLDPKLSPKVRVHAVDLSSGAKVVILRVPRSIAAPHMLREHGWFYARRGALNLQLSTSELRAAFVVSETWAERVRRFRDERIARVLGDETPVRLNGADRCIIHLVPLAPALERTRLDVAQFVQAPPLVSANSYGARFNADGLVVIPDESKEGSHSYTQFFRDGAVEAVSYAASVTREGVFFPSRYEVLTVDTVRNYRPLLEQAGATGPFVVLLSLSGLRGLMPVDPDPHAYPDRRRPAERDLYTMPDVVLTDEEALDADLRPMFDTIWQCFGFRSSPNFGSNGRWLRRE